MSQTHPCPHCQTEIPAHATVCQHCGFNLAKGSKPQSFSGALLGNLRLTGIIGEGGMGSVYKAEHTTLGTTYAVKILHGNMSRDKVFAERFRREAIACSRLRHQNIVYVTDFGQHPDLGLYLVMEYLQGEDLCALQTRKGKLELWRVGVIGQQVCDALYAAHREGIVHRDMKPENIFLARNFGDDVVVKLLDFGVAKMGVNEVQQNQLTQQGIALGTPYYMSPEQATGQSAKIGPHSDIYALGAILYEIIVGKTLFDGDSPFKIMSAHVRTEAPSLGEARPELKGTQLETLLLDMVAKASADRPASALVVKERLQAALQELRDRGVTEAFEPLDPAITADSGVYRPMVKQGERLSGILQNLEPPPDGPRLSNALKLLGTFTNPDEELIFWMAWGVLMRDLLDPALDSPRFKLSEKAAQLYLKHVLTVASKADEEAVRARVGKAISDLLNLADKARRQPLVNTLQPLMSLPLYPHDAMPAWSKPEIGGSWTAGIASFFRTPVSDLLFGKDEDEDPPTLAEVPREKEPAEDLSLTDKLKKDVSFRNLRSILGHEIKIFDDKGKKGDVKPDSRPAPRNKPSE